jgi:DNA-binding CsgD family transcriptional regulator
MPTTSCTNAEKAPQVRWRRSRKAVERRSSGETGTAALDGSDDWDLAVPPLRTRIQAIVAQLDSAVGRLERDRGKPDSLPFLDPDSSFVALLWDVRRELLSCRHAAEQLTALARTLASSARSAESETGSGAGSQPSSREPISRRENEVLKLLSVGASNQTIALSLGVSVNTVKWHLKNIFCKLGVANRTVAVLVAKREGYVS